MRRSIIVLLTIALSAPGPAFGQSKDDEVRADAMFNAGKALLDAGQYVDACAKFAESSRLSPGVGVTLYLADCYERIGRVASAWTAFRSAEGLARARGDKRAEVAQHRAQILEAKLERLTVSVAPTLPTDGLRILLDGTTVPQEEWGLANPVDPGDHAVVVTSPGHEARTLTAHVDASNPAATIRIDALGAPPPSTSAVDSKPGPPPSATAVATEATPSLSATPDVSTADPSTGKTRRWSGLGAGGLGALGLGAGVVLGLIAKSRQDASNSGPCDAATDRCSGAGLAQRQDAFGFATASTAAFIAGGIAIAGGATLFLTAPRSTGSASLVVAPAPMVGGGGAILHACF